jgi:DNA-binding beta-propeller fold protein YncE
MRLFLFLLVGLVILSCLPAHAAALRDVYTRIYIADQYKPGILVLDPDSYEPVVDLNSVPSESVSLLAGNRDMIFIIGSHVLRAFRRDDFFPLGITTYDGDPAPGQGKVLVSRDGRRLYIGAPSWGRAGSSGIYIIDLEQGRQTAVWEKDKLLSGFFDLSPDGRVLAVPSNPIRLLDARTGACLREIILKENQVVKEVVFYSDEVLLAGVQADTTSCVLGIQLPSGTTSVIDLPNVLYRLQLLPRDILYALCKDHLVKIDLHTGVVVESLMMIGDNLGVSPDGAWLYVLSGFTHQLTVVNPQNNAVGRSVACPGNPAEILAQ